MIKARKVFFFEKKKQKTFAPGLPKDPTRKPRRAPEQAKVFWFFFSKKNILSSWDHQIARFLLSRRFPPSRRG
jgi:hypothetical protein